jgi:hypothetical protein
MPFSGFWRRVQTELSLQPPAHINSSLADLSTLKMEAICSSETSVHIRSTRRHIPENAIVHSHRCENLRSYINKRSLPNFMWMPNTRVTGIHDTQNRVACPERLLLQ